MKLAMVDPELRRAARWMQRPPVGNALGRALVRAMLRWVPATAVDGVAIETRAGVTPRLRIYRPHAPCSDGALFWIHGGGYVIGRPVQDDRLCGSVCAALGVSVISVEYRLAPEHPFPAAADDCLAGWNWTRDNAGALGVDPRRIAIGGQSAGGGLAASLVQRVHDAGTGDAKAQWLFCPMLDDRTAARRNLDGIGHFVWHNRLNAAGWRAYLGREPGSAELPAYAAAGRRDDLTGLPPAWIGVGAIDLFHAEDSAYATRLGAAGVEVTLVTVPGAPHGFEAWGWGTAIARRYHAQALSWLGETLARP